MNVKIIGANETLTNAFINASATSDLNLWIKNLNIHTTTDGTIIKFGDNSESYNYSGNYLIVEGENTLTKKLTASQNPIVHIGEGLNITGDGSLTASIDSPGNCFSSGIGATRYQSLSFPLNIGGNVTLNVTIEDTFHGKAIGGPRRHRSGRYRRQR